MAISLVGALTKFVFAYQGQDIFCEVIAEMRNEKDSPKGITMAYSTMTVVYMFTTILAYGFNGKYVEGFLPDTLDPGWMTQVVGGLIGFHVYVSYCCLGIPFLNVIYAKCMGDSHPVWKGGSTQRMTWFFISLITIFTSYIIAVMLPLFDLLSMILGALCGAPIVFGWPAIFYLVACKRKGISMSCFDTFMCYAYLFFFLPLFVIFGAYDSIGLIAGSELVRPPSEVFGTCKTGAMGGGERLML